MLGHFQKNVVHFIKTGGGNYILICWFIIKKLVKNKLELFSIKINEMVLRKRAVNTYLEGSYFCSFLVPPIMSIKIIVVVRVTCCSSGTSQLFCSTNNYNTGQVHYNDDGYFRFFLLHILNVCIEHIFVVPTT